MEGGVSCRGREGVIDGLIERGIEGGRTRRGKVKLRDNEIDRGNEK
jgi:hypothetical protein